MKYGVGGSEKCKRDRHGSQVLLWYALARSSSNEDESPKIEMPPVARIVASNGLSNYRPSNGAWRQNKSVVAPVVVGPEVP